MIDRWRTTLNLATKREYIAQRCYCSLFKFMDDYKQGYEIHQERCEKKDTKLCKAIADFLFFLSFVGMGVICHKV